MAILKRVLFGLFCFFIIAVAMIFIIVWPERGHGDKLRISATKMAIKTMAGQAELYKEDKGFYPKSLDDLVPIYLTQVPLDVWGNEYQYSVNDNFFQIKSFGEDGKLGGQGPNTDISNLGSSVDRLK